MIVISARDFVKILLFSSVDIIKKKDESLTNNCVPSQFTKSK